MSVEPAPQARSAVQKAPDAGLGPNFRCGIRWNRRGKTLRPWRFQVLACHVRHPQSLAHRVNQVREVLGACPG